MAKVIRVVSGLFDLSAVTAAFSLADNAASAWDALTAEMVQWHAAGVFPPARDVKAALVAAGRPDATAGSQASKVLAWAKSGKVPKSISLMVRDYPVGHVKKKAGRPAGKKAAAPAVAAAAAGVEGLSPMHRWATILQDMIAGALIVRDARNQTFSVTDAKELQAALMVAKAIIGRYL
jgi:hypothetical protein